MVYDKVVVGGNGRTEEEDARNTELKLRTPYKIMGNYKKLLN
jgi:hypothetical protein